MKSTDADKLAFLYESVFENVERDFISLGKLVFEISPTSFEKILSGRNSMLSDRLPNSAVLMDVGRKVMEIAWRDGEVFDNKVGAIKKDYEEKGSKSVLMKIINKFRQSPLDTIHKTKTPKIFNR